MATKDNFPFKVHSPRGDFAFWYDQRWPEMSDWCSENFASAEWDYFGEHFVFTKEEHKLLFVLRWN